MNRCRPRRRQVKRLNLAIDAETFSRFLPVMQRDWGDSISSWMEFAMECYSRETCDGCPYAEEEGQQKVGIGQVAPREQED